MKTNFESLFEYLLRLPQGGPMEMFDMVTCDEALPCDRVDMCVRHMRPVAENTPLTVFLVMHVCEVLAAKELF
jgi:hypothetical protein